MASNGSRKKESKTSKDKGPFRTSGADSKFPEVILHREQPRSKLLLVPGTGDSPKLASDVMQILQEVYGFGNRVDILQSLRPSEVSKGTPKTHVYPYVPGRFADGETRVDMGRNALYDEIRGTHVAIIKYMFTPRRMRSMHSKKEEGELENGKYDLDMSINDHIAEVRGFLNILKRWKTKAETLERTVVFPYCPYLRSHSIEKYDKKGFLQADTLEMLVEDLSRGDVNNMVMIDPHSDKIKAVAENYNIAVSAVDPFRPSDGINPLKLGLPLDEDGNPLDETQRILHKLEPFIDYYRQALKTEEGRQHYRKVAFIACDDNAEIRTQDFHKDCKIYVDPTRTWKQVGYRYKERQTIEGASGIWKKFSPINENTIDPDTTYVITDDMISSGGTVNDIARELKKLGAKRVELWASHAVAPEREKLEKLDAVDRIVVLDTILHDEPEKMGLTYVNVTAHLIAAELVKLHGKIDSQRY